MADLESDYDGDEPREDVSRQGLAREMRSKHRALQVTAMLMRKLGTNAVALLVRGSPVKKALQQLDRRSPDLVMVGKGGHGRLSGFLPGHVGTTVARKARCAVLVVPGPGTTGIGSTMCSRSLRA